MKAVLSVIGCRLLKHPVLWESSKLLSILPRAIWHLLDSVGKFSWVRDLDTLNAEMGYVCHFNSPISSWDCVDSRKAHIFKKLYSIISQAHDDF